MIQATATDLRKAADLQDRIDDLTQKRDALLNGKVRELKINAVHKGRAPAKKKRNMTAKGRAAIVAAQKKRWAKAKKTTKK